MGRKRSGIWAHFESLSASKCKICNNIFSVAGGSTSNMRRHLSTKHVTVHLESEDGSRPAATPQSSQPAANEGTTRGPTTQATRPINQPATGGPPSIEPQPALKKRTQTRMGSYVNPPMSNLRKTELDVELVRMMATDFQPFSIVEDRGFRRWCRKLNPSYELPSRRIITRKNLPQENTKGFMAVSLMGSS